MGSWLLRWFTRTPFDSGPRLHFNHMKIEGDYMIMDGTEVNGKPAQPDDEYRYRLNLRTPFSGEWFRVGSTTPYTTDDHYQIRRLAPKADLYQHFI